MTGFIEDDVLRFEGLSTEDIAKLNERLPDLQNLITVLQTHMPQINRVIADLGPIAQKIIAKQQELQT